METDFVPVVASKRRTSSCLFAASVVFLLAATISNGTAQTLAAQTLSGHVTLAGDGSPVSLALVLLEDARGEAVARTMTRTNGAFTLAWSGDPTMSVRAERIGLGSVAVPVPTTTAGRASIVLRLSPTPIEIDGISVEAGSRCPLAVNQAGLTDAWAEFRGLLTSLRSLDRERGRQFEVVMSEGNRSLRGEPEGEQVVDTVIMSRPTPFVSAGADYLAENGFVVQESAIEVMYYAPDAHVLLSDEFLGSHCYRYGEQNRPGYTVIAFGPVDPNAPLDVTGIFALPQQPDLLPRIEFQFTSHPWGFGSDPRLGGFVEMAPTEIGWVVSEWELRVPNPPRINFSDRGPVLTSYYVYRGELNRFILGEGR